MPEPLLRWLATCPEDTRDVLLNELVAMGVSDPKPLHRGVAFEANLETGYRAHLVLRTASRIQRIIGDVPAMNATTLAQSVRDVDWPSFLRTHRPIAIDVILNDNPARAMGQTAVLNMLKNAIAAGFPPGTALRFDQEADNPVTVIAHIRGGVCTLGLDTAGRALHKRGWRMNGHPAVIKETLAAAILLLAGYDGSIPLLDPMCGSGTIVIEAAYIALHKGVLIHRGKDDFGLEHHAGFDRNLWRKVSDQVRAEKLAAPPAPIFASDIQAKYVELSRQGALRGRVERHITFAVSPFESLTPPADHGLLVANLPYGQRIGGGGAQVQGLYTAVGRTIRERYRNWRIALLMPEHAPRGALGLRTDRDIPMMNGALPVRLLITEPGK